IVAALVALPAGRQLAASKIERPIVTDDVYRAGLWARANLPPACIDYLTDDYTGYWLHLAVLGNTRSSVRATHPDTFHRDKAIERWIYPNGLPYAIVDDVETFSAALFDGTDIVARFGRAEVIKRRGASTCDPH